MKRTKNMKLKLNGKRLYIEMVFEDKAIENRRYIKCRTLDMDNPDLQGEDIEIVFLSNKLYDPEWEKNFNFIELGEPKTKDD
jgi:uncharacterized protein (DUF1684 family)